jgi:Gpi18-like mannosyltransferase
LSDNPSAESPAVGTSFHQTLDRFLIDAFVVSKLAVVFLLLAAFNFIPSHANLWNRLYTRDVRDTLYIPFCNWDGQHYLLLADWGYGSHAAQYSAGFYPLFPLSISLTNTVLSNLYLAALVNVTIFSFLFLWIYYAYARRYLPVNRARLAVVLLLLFPASMFLSVFYSESLFLLCFFAFLLFYESKRSGAFAFALLLPLIRGQGMFVACAIVAYLSWQIWRRGKPDVRYELKVLAGFAVGTTLYFLFYKLTTGNAVAGIRAQEYTVAGSSAVRILNVLGFIRYLLSPSPSWFAYNNGRLDKLFVVLMLLGIPVVMRTKTPLHLFLYAILVYFPAAMGVGAMSFARYSLLAVPFLVIALMQLCTSRKTCLIAFACAGTVFLAIQMVFIVRFALNLWTG